MLRVSSPAQATSRSISDFIKTRKSQSHGSSSDDKAADDIVRQDCQELTPASQSQADCLRQSGVGYFLEPDLPVFPSLELCENALFDGAQVNGLTACSTRFGHSSVRVVHRI